MTLAELAKTSAGKLPANAHLFEQKEKQPAKPEPKGLQFIKQALDAAGVGYMTELQFAKPRRFKFDIAIPPLMVAIEYEGLVAPGQMGGHQTTAGYTSNTEKYNLAASKGWKLYRYTSRNYKNFDNDLKEILNAGAV